MSKQNILAPEFLDHFHKKVHEPITAIPTNLPTLNSISRGPGGGIGIKGFICVSGNPASGKSALALGFASAALNHGIDGGVAMINLEMSAEATATRMYALHTNTRIAALEQGNFDDSAFEQARRSMEGSQPLWVPEGLLTSYDDCLRYMNDCLSAGCRYYILDYLQLISSGNESEIYANTQRVVTSLRAWGVQNDATIICLSQFNRTTSSNYEQSPRMTGLFGGMILEASCDLIALLDHSRYERDQNTARTWLIIAKNRHGPTLEIPIEWDYRTLSVREGDPHEEHLWPE